MTQLTDVGAAQIATIDNLEISYKGKIIKKLSRDRFLLCCTKRIC